MLALRSRISSALILAVISSVTLSSFYVSAFDLTRSLSMAEGLGGLLKHEHLAGPQYASDDALITSQARSKNKVSAALRYLHNKAGDVVYKRHGSEGAVPVEAMNMRLQDGDSPMDNSAPRAPDTRTDDQVIADACKGRATRTCGYAVSTALKSSPEHKARIALALRRKPDYVDAGKLLYHKLFESAISKVEEKGLDSKLDSGLDLVLTKTPYGFMASQAFNMAVKTL